MLFTTNKIQIDNVQKSIGTSKKFNQQKQEYEDITWRRTTFNIRLGTKNQHKGKMYGIYWGEKDISDGSLVYVTGDLYVDMNRAGDNTMRYYPKILIKDFKICQPINSIEENTTL